MIKGINQDEHDPNKRAGSALTNITADPIVLTSRTGGTASEPAPSANLEAVPEAREADQIGKAER